MIIDAMLLTTENFELAAASLDDYTVEDLHAEADHILKAGFLVVLIRDTFDGFRSVNAIISLNYFAANYPTIDLNDETFTKVNEI